MPQPEPRPQRAASGGGKSPQSDVVLVERILRGETDAWNELIQRYEGRLLAFVESRLHHRAAGEDVVQETFIGLLTSLPNYDCSRPLESYLFSIAAHKLTDHLRREGRRPALPLAAADDSGGGRELAGRARAASSLMRSGERRKLEQTSLAEAIGQQIDQWRQRGDWQKINCMELLIVRGWANKDVAARLNLSEQQVANYKFDFLARLRSSVRGQGLSADVFPELYEKQWTRMTRPFSNSDLEGYLDEALPAEEMSAIEAALRDDPAWGSRLAAIHARRDAGVHSLGEIWRRERLSCPSREQLGSYLLGALPDEVAQYIALHLEAVACRYCRANLDDLERQHAASDSGADQRRRKYFQSSAGYLKKQH